MVGSVVLEGNGDGEDGLLKHIALARRTESAQNWSGEWLFLRRTVGGPLGSFEGVQRYMEQVAAQGTHKRSTAVL